ncbi:MAG: toll/interleukin-1 receptor domain-containing protein [Pirellulales bacterium]|nr:toll/interleukin-1 receptor domain-containing protein [Pirellulales bacterium]
MCNSKDRVIEGREADAETPLDFFLSYKSEDVAVVRMVAEQMRASGLRVWFAEYDVLLKDREQFRGAIENAIQGSRFGVCFTNDRFIQSAYCSWEVELLLKRLGAERIVEIALPRQPLPHRLFPDLLAAKCLEVPTAQFSETDAAESGSARSFVLPCSTVDAILAHIQTSTGISISGCGCAAPGGPVRRSFRSRGVKYSLDVSGWNVSRPGLLARLIGRGGGDALGPRFSKHCPGGNMWGHIIVGTQDVQRKQLAFGTSDDRAYYDEALQFAGHYFGDVWKQHCLGVHLFFLEGFSHPAFTTLARSGMAALMGNPTWSRVYSVTLRGRWKWSRDLEFAFFFFFRGGLASFLRSAHLMDKLVLSFQRKSH